MSARGRLLKPVALTQEHVDSANNFTMNSINVLKVRDSSAAMERRQGSNTGSGDVVNDAIDIRIALEALFAPTGSKTEFGHSIALGGAWYLGTGPDDHIRYYRSLKRAYDLCSSVVHSGSFHRGKVSTDDALKLLNEAWIARFHQCSR